MQSVLTFSAESELDGASTWTDVLTFLKDNAVTYHESSKSICLLGSDSMRPISRALHTYYAPLVTSPLCWKLSKSQQFVAEHDVTYVGTGAPTERIARQGTVRSKLPVGNLLSLHQAAPRIYDICVMTLGDTLRMVTQVCEYFPGVVKSRRRVQNLSRRLRTALEEEGLVNVSPHGWNDPDFSYRSNNFCGDAHLRFVDMQKFAFAHETQHATTFDDVTRTWCLEPLRMDWSDRVVVGIGVEHLRFCAAILSCGAAWYRGVTPEPVTSISRQLYRAGYSRFELSNEFRPDGLNQADVVVICDTSSGETTTWCAESSQWRQLVAIVPDEQVDRILRALTCSSDADQLTVDIKPFGDGQTVVHASRRGNGG